MQRERNGGQYQGKSAEQKNTGSGIALFRRRTIQKMNIGGTCKCLDGCLQGAAC